MSLVIKLFGAHILMACIKENSYGRHLSYIAWHIGKFNYYNIDCYRYRQENLDYGRGKNFCRKS